MHHRRTVRVISVFGLALAALAAAASSQTRIDRQLSMAPGGTVVVDADVGDVRITAHDGETVNVLITSQRDLEDDFRIDVRETADGVLVELERPDRNWRRSWRGPGVEIELEVPVRSEIDVKTAGGDLDLRGTVGTARLRTSGGSVDVVSVEGDVEARTSGGSIDVRDVIGSVDADTSGGNIDGSAVTGSFRADTSGGSIDLADVGGDVDASTSGGRIDIEAVGGMVDAHTSGGGVSVAFGPGNSSGGRISSSGGSVTVYLDPSVGLDLDASASGGSVKTDFPVTIQGRVSRTSLKGVLNGGGETLRVRSSGGGVSLREGR